MVSTSQGEREHKNALCRVPLLPRSATGGTGRALMRFAFHVEGCGLAQCTREAQTPEHTGGTSDSSKPRRVLSLRGTSSQGRRFFLPVLGYTQFPSTSLPF